MTSPEQSFFIEEPTVVPNHKASDEPRKNPFIRSSTERSKTQSRKTSKPAPPYVEGAVRQTVIDTYGMLAFTLMPFKPSISIRMLGPSKPPSEDNPEPQSVIENCADAWEMAAKQFPVVRKMFTTSQNMVIIAALVTAHAPIAAAVFEETPLAEKFNPAAAMQAYLRRQTEQSTGDTAQ